MRQVLKLEHKEAKLEERSLKHKSYLLALKYIPHFTCLFYIVYTLLQFANIDLILFGYLFHISIIPWLFMLLSSLVFRFCYIHRLPLYYILINEVSSIYDYYIGIPVSEKGLLGIHLTFIGIIMFCYTKYYLKYGRSNKVYFKTTT